MTGRGRPRKAKSPDTKPEERKQVYQPKGRGKEFTERHNGITKEQKPREQKKTIHTEENPSVQTTKHSTKGIDKQEMTPTDGTKAPVHGAKANSFAGATKTTEQFTEEIKTRPETTKDTTKHSPKAAKAKTCGGKAKSPVEFVEETTKAQPQKPKGTTKPKTRAGEVKSPVEFVEETTEAQPQKPKGATKPKTHADKVKSPEKCRPQMPKGITKARVPQDRCETVEDSILYTTLEKLKIKRDERADAAEVVNTITKHIIRHLKNNTQCFKEVEEPLRTGSYYENLKISNPDEFDVMLPIPVDRVSIEPFRDNGAFYSVALKRGRSPLEKFQETTTLSASKMLEEFREEVKKGVKDFKEWEVTKKKKGCPAVTLTTTVQSVTISLDVVLSLMVKSSWPPFTNEGLQIDGWLGTKVKQEYKRKHYYLVPKYEGKGIVETDGVLAKDCWRISFSHIEKAILMNHGSEKTCCEKAGARCCRKDCLKLLKHLLSLLKEKDPSLDKFCSYHAKTTLLHACCSRTKDSDWSASNLSHCFKLLLDDFVAHLERGVLNNFFIPTQDLLSSLGKNKCNRLARSIREERDKSFPIFK